MSARDVTHFTINTTHFLAIANNFDGVTYRVDSQIFLFEHGAPRLVSREREREGGGLYSTHTHTYLYICIYIYI